MLVYEFSGAGTQFLTWLHSVASSSQTILEANDRYSRAALLDTISFIPQKFCSAEVATALAKLAFARAQDLTKIADFYNENLTNKPLLGLSCTASIATSKEKRGEHKCYIAICDNLGTITYELTLQKGRDRKAEEELISLLLLKALVKYCALETLEIPLLVSEKVKSHFEPAQQLQNFIKQKDNYLKISTSGQLTLAKKESGKALLSGSFNPLHKGHLELAQVAAKKLARPVDFELPLINADKAAIDLNETLERTRQFLGRENLYLTQSPLFSHKTTLFPNSIFIVGVDTAIRLLEPRFYQNSMQQMLTHLELLQQSGCSFLVASRLVNGTFLSLRDIIVPQGFSNLFIDLSEKDFRLDISSAAIRNRLAPISSKE